jgi:hypothetical protein
MGGGKGGTCPSLWKNVKNLGKLFNMIKKYLLNLKNQVISYK